jgi:hypothetical protein
MNIDQATIDATLGLANLLIGFYLKVVWDSLKALKDTDDQLADKVNRIEVLVAGQYVHRDEFHSLSKALFAKLDKIEDKLDGKADR